MKDRHAALMKQRPALKRRKINLKFFGETLSELKKAVWPTREEAIRLTIMVLIVSLVMGLVLGAIDFSFTRLVNDVLLR